MKRTISGPDGVYVELDTSDAATPAMVYSKKHRNASSTYDCACGEGILADSREGDIELSAAAMRWLDSLADDVEKTFDVARKDHPEYN